ncbi:uncharacterized protein LTR77_003121 [Saxophila tyrrhenica]|uniref:CUE domain-containing protein n=1 Tax=Saxophila tyrrhenica TaxID=1690608 RepID=A0AAV9PJA7_9PEZI|nr:hypothetical protein LTR77_003121 [Saxophila tyrrhenica]
MSLPPLADIPPSTIRLSIAPEEWEACLASWLTLTGLYLGTPTNNKLPGSINPYLKSFYCESARAGPTDDTLRSPIALRLRKASFMLVKQVLDDPKTSPELLDFDFIANFSRIHARNASLPALLKGLWQRQDATFQKSFQKRKSSLLKGLGSTSAQGTLDGLRQVADVMRASPEVAVLFMTGSDFVDSLASHYQRSGTVDQRKALVATAYFGLLGLVKVEPPNMSMLSDHLYSLKAQADSTKKQTSLLADLVTNTALTKKLRSSVGATSAARLHSLLDTIDTYQTQSIAQPRKRVRRTKGKGKASQSNGEMHMHRLSLVTQIQDLFPDLGSGFVLKLLDEYNDDVEQVTAHLLDDSLPSHLHNADRTEQAPVFDKTEQSKIEDLAPSSTPPLQPFIPERRNVFDDDELDRLEMDTSRLHLGKKNQTQSSDNPNKAAILSALAAFDSDEDERDDTYDVEDVGGTVDTAHPDGEPGPSAKVTQEENDMALFAAYKSSPQLFGRTFDIRRGQARQALKAETGMSDEQIEGWATMLQRDPRRLKRLEGQFGAFDGKQAHLARTSYRESPGGTETEDSDVPAERGGFGGTGRGRGRGGRGRGGSVAGPSSDPNTANAQRRKEASKGSRANHNRRDQRAKKMARGGFPG